MDIKHQVFYRGELKSCNYSCDYCPFSKRTSLKELKKDEKSLERFVTTIERKELKTRAIQFVPYGEALIHEYYWRAISRLSRISIIEAVGCQTNLSFPIKKMLEVFYQSFGNSKKLRLWCTFHPSMISIERFMEQCRLLESESISFCVGAVGVPEQIDLLEELRSCLKDSIYIWINPMDGLRRSYTENEIQRFLKIDPFFSYQLKHRKAEPSSCRGCSEETIFVHSNGDITACNISKVKMGNLYTKPHSVSSMTEKRVCGQKECNCFLAYSNRMDYKEMILYGKYPAFRMAQIPKAMFFDVDGTLVKEGSDTLEPKVIEQIKQWSYHSKLYLATSLPRNYAMKKCKEIKPWLAGGVFANGGMICLFEEKKTEIIPIELDIIDFLERINKCFSIKVKVYKKEDLIYKITCKGKSVQRIEKIIQREYGKSNKITMILENDYLEITGEKADKLNGVLKICNRYGYQTKEVAVAGNSQNDSPMLRYFPMSIKVSL